MLDKYYKALDEMCLNCQYRNDYCCKRCNEKAVLLELLNKLYVKSNKIKDHTYVFVEVDINECFVKEKNLNE